MSVSPEVPKTSDKQSDIKIILLGDSAVGKSKLVERFLLDDFHPQQLSTFALTLYRHTCSNPIPLEQRGKAAGDVTAKEKIDLEIWDTAGQERFQTLHPSYYHMAHCCILCFDVTRKVTYKNLDTWYKELMQYRGTGIPTVLLANKIDLEPSRATKTYAFIEQRKAERNGDFPVFFGSASDGTNVVSAFHEAIQRALEYKQYGSSRSAAVASSALQLEDDPANDILRFIQEETERDGGIFSKSREDAAAAVTTKPDLNMAYSDDEIDVSAIKASQQQKQQQQQQQQQQKKSNIQRA